MRLVRLAPDGVSARNPGALRHRDASRVRAGLRGRGRSVVSRAQLALWAVALVETPLVRRRRASRRTAGP